MNVILAELRKKAAARQLQANLVLAAIACIIFSGGVFLVYANTISERGLGTATQEIENVNANLPTRLSEIQSDLGALKASFQEYQSSRSSVDDTLEDFTVQAEQLLSRFGESFDVGINELRVAGEARELSIEEFEAAVTDWADQTRDVFFGSLNEISVPLLDLNKRLGECLETRQTQGYYYDNRADCLGPLSQLALLSSQEEDFASRLENAQLPDFVLPTYQKIELDSSVADQIASDTNRYFNASISQYAETSGRIESVAESIRASEPEFSALENLVLSLENGQERFNEAVVRFSEVQEAIEAQDWFSFTKATILRVGVIVLMIFLVQILVNLFRYSTRLSAFYYARADALELAQLNGSKLSVEELSIFMRAMSPDNLDFGKQLRSPVDQAVEISRNLAHSSSNANSR